MQKYTWSRRARRGLTDTNRDKIANYLVNGKSVKWIMARIPFVTPRQINGLKGALIQQNRLFA